jgi:uncharacterized protein YqgQ
MSVINKRESIKLLMISSQDYLYLGWRKTVINSFSKILSRMFNALLMRKTKCNNCKLVLLCRQKDEQKFIDNIQLFKYPKLDINEE